MEFVTKHIYSVVFYYSRVKQYPTMLGVQCQNYEEKKRRRIKTLETYVVTSLGYFSHTVSSSSSSSLPPPPLLSLSLSHFDTIRSLTRIHTESCTPGPISAKSKQPHNCVYLLNGDDNEKYILKKEEEKERKKKEKKKSKQQKTNKNKQTNQKMRGTQITGVYIFIHMGPVQEHL